jgi:hypothetical protein
MSHVSTVEIEIKDVPALAAACSAMGLELVLDQKQYRWFGEHVGDYPIPDGFTKDDLGRCEHAIRIPGDGKAYEIGVVKRRDGKPGYVLMWDFWAGGYGLQDKVGKDCGRLAQEYAAQVAIKKAKLQGFNVQRKQLEDGRVQLVCVR